VPGCREIQPQGLKGQVHVPDEEHERSDQGAHAPDEERHDRACDLESEQSAAEQQDDEDGDEEHAEGRQGDAGSENPRPPRKNPELGVADFPFVALGDFTLVGDQSRTVDDPANPVRHAQEEQANARDQDHRTNRQLKRWNQRFERQRILHDPGPVDLVERAAEAPLTRGHLEAFFSISSPETAGVGRS
jgi:hypothetical protein